MYSDFGYDEKDVLLVEKVGKVAYFTFNRPQRSNALSRQVIDQMLTELDALRNDDTISVIVLKGNGKGFSAGFDVGGDDPERKAISGVMSDWRRLEKNMDIFLEFWKYPKPVIAQVHGYCMGGATQLCVCCDIVICADDTRFGFPKMPLGGGFVGPMWALKVGPSRAKMMDLNAGSEINGITAEKWNFATKSVPLEELDEEVKKLAKGIARTPLDMLTMKKFAVNRIADVQGFTNCVMFGPEWDSILHFSDGCLATKAKIKELGFKEAFKWFNEQEV